MSTIAIYLIWSIFLAPTEVEGKGLKFWCDITFQQKTSQYIKLERIVVIFGFLVNMENTKQYILIPPLRPFSLKNDGLPLNSLFWFSPTAVHRFDASDMAVPGLHISCTRLQELILVVLKLKLSKLSTPYIFATLHLNCYQLSNVD